MAGSGKFGGQVTDADPLQVTMAGSGSAGEAHLGEVGGAGSVVSQTLVLDTNIYADGDVLSVPATATLLRVNDGTGVLESLMVIDEDDQGIGLDVFYFDAAVTLGTINSAPSISDADARSYLGHVRVNASDFIDLGGVRIAKKGLADCGFLLKAVSGAKTVYVATITRGGTPTYSASGIKLRHGVLQN